MASPPPSNRLRNRRRSRALLARHDRSASLAGQLYERLALAYLKQAGLRVLATGYQCRFGELDLVCQQDDGLVIVEVRGRRHVDVASAAASVDRHKQRRIIATTRHFLMTHPHWANHPLRFDVLAISAVEANPDIHWIKNAFDAM